MTTARNDRFEPDWAKPQNWPVRRRAPGYPRRFVVPSFTVLAVAIGLVVLGFSKGPLALVWIGLSLFLVGHAIVYRLTLSRFCCPECGKLITLKHYPEPGAFFRFHCQRCNIIWLTSVQVGNNEVGSLGD
jgi:hypothetical protein